MRRLMAILLALMMPLWALAEPAAVSGDAAAALKAAFQRYSTLGACVAVFQNGEITHVYCYGTERIAGAEITPDTCFQVGSISKMVANIGLMQLLTEQGIGLDTEIGAVLGMAVRNPAYPDTPVTLRQLMTHTASLRDGGGYQSALSGEDVTLESLFGPRADTTFFSGYEPGLRREYSNFGGGLIGSLIEKLSGQTVDDYMQQQVFGPLDITAAFQPTLLDESVSLAALYHMPERRIAKDLRDGPAPVTEPDYQRHYTYTAGKLTISAPDLCKLLIALCDGGMYRDVRILKESAVGEITTRQNHCGSVACESGNGLFMNIITDDQVQGRTMYGHGGKANGMLCAAYFDPADRTGVVMLTNGCRNNSVYNGVGMLGRVVMRICYDQILADGEEVKDPFEVD